MREVDLCLKMTFSSMLKEERKSVSKVTQTSRPLTKLVKNKINFPSNFQGPSFFNERVFWNFFMTLTTTLQNGTEKEGKKSQEQNHWKGRENARFL
ncbi:MAG: hypothetical protein VX839_05845 [Verrucomicrobiota bacterium]|nr:hypothetical protein [Verrucomicrobiota bacterium]